MHFRIGSAVHSCSQSGSSYGLAGTLREVYKLRQPHFHIISQSQLVDQRRSIISEEASCIGENTATACQRVEWHPGIHWPPKPPENVAVESSYEGALWSYDVWPRPRLTLPSTPASRKSPHDEWTPEEWRRVRYFGKTPSKVTFAWLTSKGPF
jgi:hypothetical protein